jgi:hypothetical protein
VTLISILKGEIKHANALRKRKALTPVMSYLQMEQDGGAPSYAQPWVTMQLAVSLWGGLVPLQTPGQGQVCSLVLPHSPGGGADSHGYRKNAS